MEEVNQDCRVKKIRFGGKVLQKNRQLIYLKEETILKGITMSTSILNGTKSRKEGNEHNDRSGVTPIVGVDCLKNITRIKQWL